MDIDERHSFNWILLIIGVLAILANGLLLWTARHLYQHTLEIKYAMLLALVDIFIAVLAISACILDNWHPSDVGSFRAFCMVKGPVDFLLKYSSLVLVAVMAMERHYKVRGSNIPLPVWIVVGLCSFVFSGLVLVAIAQNQFHTTLSGCNCMPVASESILSAVVVFCLGFSMLISLAATLFAYLSIISIVKETRLRTGRVHKHRDRVIIRVFTISFIYLLLIAPASVFIMMEGSRTFQTSHLVDTIIALLTCLNAIANPCLVLFAHSLIFKQLKQSFTTAILRRSSTKLCNISL